jgi:hypothetical protein
MLSLLQIEFLVGVHEQLVREFEPSTNSCQVEQKNSLATSDLTLMATISLEFRLLQT